MNSGKALESEVMKSLQHLKNMYGKDFVYRRIPDAKDYAINWCPNCRSYKRSKLILTKNPADFVFTYKGLTFYLEAKSSMANRYQLNWIKDHQVTDLIEHKEAGCKGWIMLCYRASLAGIKGKKKVYDKNRAWIILPEIILKYKNEGTVSLTWNEIESIGVEVTRKKGVWELNTIIELDNTLK